MCLCAMHVVLYLPKGGNLVVVASPQRPPMAPKGPCLLLLGALEHRTAVKTAGCGLGGQVKKACKFPLQSLQYIY